MGISAITACPRQTCNAYLILIMKFQCLIEQAGPAWDPGDRQYLGSTTTRYDMDVVYWHGYPWYGTGYPRKTWEGGRITCAG